jgi:hypothetical protein
VKNYINEKFIKDVQVDGKSVVTDGVAEIPKYTLTEQDKSDIAALVLDSLAAAETEEP